MSIWRFFKRFARSICNYRRIAVLRKSSRIGRAVRVSAGARIGSACVLGDRVVVAVEVELADRVTVGKGAYLERIRIGADSVFDARALITGFGTGSISIGHDSYIGPDTALDFSADITIGNYVHIAGLSTGLWTHSSALMCLAGIALADKAPLHRPTAPIVVEDNVYIGGNCTLYPGVRIGHHSVVAPNSAVSKDVEPYSMVGGVPAHFIKSTRDMLSGIPEPGISE